MSWISCGTNTKARRRYLLRTVILCIGYLLATYGTTVFVTHHHPHVAEVYALALLPSILMIGLIAAVGLYLREEQDEFKRMLMVVSMLWATGGTLAITTFTDFLHSYGAIRSIPFMTSCTFWILFAVAQAVQQLLNRGGGDE